MKFKKLVYLVISAIVFVSFLVGCAGPTDENAPVDDVGENSWYFVETDTVDWIGLYGILGYKTNSNMALAIDDWMVKNAGDYSDVNVTIMYSNGVINGAIIDHSDRLSIGVSK